MITVCTGDGDHRGILFLFYIPSAICLHGFSHFKMIKNTIKQALMKFSYSELKSPKIHICPWQWVSNEQTQREKPVVNPETWSHEKKRFSGGLFLGYPAHGRLTKIQGAAKLHGLISYILWVQLHCWVLILSKPLSLHRLLPSPLSGLSTSSHASFPASLHKALLHVLRVLQ